MEKSEETNFRILETETGTASYYADEFDGKKTASGEIYDMNKLTAAHPSYPMNTICLVTNLKNGLSVEVRINDRMPSFKSRIIDLSLAAAKEIDMIRDGIQDVKIEVLEWGSK
jgi:rare lipoprotein A